MAEEDQGGQGGAAGAGDAGAGAGAGAAGGAGGAGGAGQGASGSGDGHGAAGAGTPPAGQFVVPKEYAEKGWAKKVKSQDDVYKLVDNLDSVAGKKRIVPDLSDLSKPEAQEYLASLRGTTKKEDYKFGENTPPEMAGEYAGLFFDAGIPASMAEKIVKGHEAIQAKEIAKMFDKDGMKAEMAKTFGDDGKRAGEVINMVSEILGPEGKDFMENKVPNHMVGFMFKFMDSIKQKYGVNDSGTGGQGGEGGGGANIEATRAAIRADIRKLDGRSHTGEEKAALLKKLDATYK
jgi:hypothetical protein